MQKYFAILLCVAASVRGSEIPDSLSVEATQENTAWTVFYKGQKLMVYSFRPQKFKPYVQELCTLRGDNILRDAPRDHLHHHGLMYAIKVNGINFWEEVSGNGVQKVLQSGKPLLDSINVKDNELPRATLSQVIHWVAPQDAFLADSTVAALLIERRTLTLTLAPSEQEVALEWKSEFEVGSKTNTVTLTGATYHGLGLRFRQEFDRLAAHSLRGVQPDLANNRQDVSVAPWASVSFDAPGHPASIAVAGHPANPCGVPTFFSMLTPFSYLSATQALDKKPLVYHTGERFELRYLILLYPMLASSDLIEKRVETWKKQNPWKESRYVPTR